MCKSGNSSIISLHSFGSRFESETQFGRLLCGKCLYPLIHLACSISLISDKVDSSLFAKDEEWSLEIGNNIKKLKENGIKTLFKLVFFIFILYLDFFINMLKIYILMRHKYLTNRLFLSVEHYWLIPTFYDLQIFWNCVLFNNFKGVI